MRCLMRLLCMAPAFAPSVRAQVCAERPVALVLAGGGAKGFAHVGVLQVLDSLGIRPDLVVGSSVGALVGALYASGLSAHQIDTLSRILPAFEGGAVSPGRAPHEWGSLLPVVLWEQGTSGFTIATGGLRELRVNALVNGLLLRANLQARGDFDRLPIRFRAVATNLRNRESVVLEGGDLAQAVRASIAVPLVFSPTRIDNQVYTDGGISANVPIAAARRVDKTARLIVVDLKEPEADTVALTSPAIVLGRLINFLFTQPLDSLGPDDIYIKPDVQGFDNLSFSSDTRRRLLAHGRAAAESMLRGVACLPRGRRGVLPLPTHLAGWEVSNGTSRDADAMGRILGLSRNSRLDPRALEAQLAELPNVEVFRELWLGPTGSGDTVGFHAQAIRAPPRVAGLGIAYDHDLGGRLWVGAQDRVILPGIETSGILTLGRYRNDLTGILLTHLGVRRMTLMPLISGQLRAEDIRRFIDDKGNYTRLPVREASGQVGLEWARLGAWRIRGTGGAIAWRTPEGENRSTLGGFVSARTEPGLPASVSADAGFTGAYRYGLIEIGTTLRSGPLTLEPAVRVGAGSRLPIQDTFEFGGSDGFPGLAIGERRGDREVVGRVQSAYVLRGPLALRVLLAAGRSDSGGALLTRSRWLGGVRAGLGATTPIGPVTFEYGFASNGRRAAFIRVGRWF